MSVFRRYSAANSPLQGTSVALLLAILLAVWGCGDSSKETEDRPVPASASIPTGIGIQQRGELSVDNYDFATVRGTLDISSLYEFVEDGGACTIEGRVFVANEPDGRVLIFSRGILGSEPVLPRDVRAEFPLTRSAARAVWFFVAQSGETWETPSCSDFWVTSGHTSIWFDSINSSVPGGRVVPQGSRVRLLLPDMVLPEPGIRWTKPPPDSDNWAITWIASVQPR